MQDDDEEEEERENKNKSFIFILMSTRWRRRRCNKAPKKKKTNEIQKNKWINKKNEQKETNDDFSNLI